MKLFVQIILILATIFGLAYYDHAIHGDEYEQMKKSKDYWKVGYVTVENIYDKSFYATNTSDTVIGFDYIASLPNGRQLETGDLISLKGKHTSADSVEVDFIHFHDGRIWKITISIIPVLVLAVLFPLFFRFDKTKRRLVKK